MYYEQIEILKENIAFLFGSVINYKSILNVFFNLLNFYGYYFYQQP